MFFVNLKIHENPWKEISPDCSLRAQSLFCGAVTPCLILELFAQ